MVGGLIGVSRNNPISGIVWGGLLGPIGWLVVLFLDERAKCPECKASFVEGARRCQHCGFVFNKDTVQKRDNYKPPSFLF